LPRVDLDRIRVEITMEHILSLLGFQPSIRYLQWHPEQGVQEEDAFPATKLETGVALIRWFLDGAGQ
jgi:hypothetical protein